MSISLNLSGKIDPQTIAVFEVVSRITAELGMPYVLVGASARDMVLHYGYGAPVQRATQDVDFAMEVPDWAAFTVLKNRLEGHGFKPTRAEHRLISPQNVVVDIVPFGQIEDEAALIAWPPEGETVMNVLGFKEACDHADWVRVQDNPELNVPVATPAGMVLLKVIAWTDRAMDMRRKDAADIAYLLASYEKIPKVCDALYSEACAQNMERYGWDITLAAAHQLGSDAHAIAQNNTRLEITRFANGEIAGRHRESLIDEMCSQRIDSLYARNEQLLTAFLSGFGITN